MQRFVGGLIIDVETALLVKGTGIGGLIKLSSSFRKMAACMVMAMLVR